MLQKQSCLSRPCIALAVFLARPDCRAVAGSEARFSDRKRRLPILSQGWRGETFLQGQSTKRQCLNAEFEVVAVLCPVELHRSLTRTETKLSAASDYFCGFSPQFCELFLWWKKHRASMLRDVKHDARPVL